MTSERQDVEQVPWPQALLDNEALLLVLGLAVPFVLYIAWGLLELSSLPVF